MLAFRRAAGKTVLSRALASSPLRFLTPRNHGSGAWVFMATFGGGLVDGDAIDVAVEVGPHATALLGTQASTKVYRSPRGCSQVLDVRVEDSAAIAVVPDPVACFSGARYRQRIDVTLAPTASLLLLDGYTAGRVARGERWELARYDSRTTIARAGSTPIVDATRLDPAHGPIAERMGRADVLLSLVVVGPRFAGVREALLAQLPSPSSSDATWIAASPVGPDATVVRVASSSFEGASRALRPGFAALAHALGDDPLARKW